MLGTDITDGYATLTAVNYNTALIHSGHLPVGAFWLPDFYGGAIATWFHMSSIPDLSQSAFLIIDSVFNNLVLSFKILMFIGLIIAQFCSYKLAKYCFKNTSVAWVVSIAYSFSAFFASKFNAGHVQFVFAAALFPVVILLFEKMFVSPNRKNMVFASISLMVLFLGDLQITIFSIYYILLRIIYYFITNRNKASYNFTLLKRLLECVASFALFVAPFLINFSMLQNAGALEVTAIPANWLSVPSQYFLRGAGSISAISGSEIYSFYLGIVLLVLAIIPMFFAKVQEKLNLKNYLFHWITFAFFLLIAIGTPLSYLVTTLFVRVPNRGQFLIVFSLCMCAGYGLLCLNDFLNQKSLRFHSLWKNKLVRTLIVIGLAAIIFVDVTSEIHPLTSPTAKLTGGDLFIESQKGDFRILKYPLVWCVSNYEFSLINHEIIGDTVIALRGYPTSSALFEQLANDFNNVPTRFGLNSSTLALLATLCGVKYVLIETNSSQPQPTQVETVSNDQTSDYINYFNNNASEYFALVYKDQDSVVYENLYFKGTVFAVKDEGQVPALPDMAMADFSKIYLPNAQINYTESFNRIEISVNVSEPAYVVLSQSYYPYWVLNNGGNSPAFVKFLNVSAFHVDAGTTTVNAVFSAADQTWDLYIGCFVPLVLLGLVIYADSKGKKRLFKLGLASLLVFGIALASLGFLGTSMAPSFLRGWAGFGVFNNVLLGLGCVIALGALLIFSKDKLFALPSFAWLYIQKLPKTLAIIVKRPNRVFGCISQLGNRVSTAVKPKVMPLDGLIQNLLRTLLIALLLFIFLANIPGLFSDAVSWLNDSVLGVIFCVVLLYATKVFFLENGNGALPTTTPVSERSKGVATKQDTLIGHLHLGVFGGLVGVCVAGLLMRVLTSYSPAVWFPGFVLCGVLGGLGFGALTNGNARLRGAVGCVFGFTAIIFGLIMTYTTPIVIGYMRSISTDGLTPIYLWHEYTFAQFVGIQLLSLHGLFYVFFGLLAAYLVASRLTLKVKSNKTV